ncbi:hypothetical protein EX30DRAFT_344984 [Ascodesmis nigricans]|uniref:Uncharacterized protein n=1 Tax=Ascodesmis nigricans TaxID=341454 RepID=A0A4S2MHY1_9PEZI|nr:hypothetical protein EX30DRAFT_344984 [Ascodesmis nigricans]
MRGPATAATTIGAAPAPAPVRAPPMRDTAILIGAGLPVDLEPAVSHPSGTQTRGGAHWGHGLLCGRTRQV